VLNEPFDAAVDRGLGREHHITFDADVHAAARNVLDCLLDDFETFKELLHADEVAGVTVTAAGTDDVEVKVRVGQIRFIPPQIPLDTTGSRHRPHSAQVDCVFATEIPDALRAVHKNAVFGEQSIDFFVDAGKFANELPHAVDPVDVDVEEHSADARVTGVETLA